MRRSMLAATIVMVLVVASLDVAHAQPPPVPPPPAPPAPLQPGDIVWTFAQEPPLFDDRVASALATLMAPRIAAAVAGVRIARVSQHGPEFVPSAVAAANQVPLLLRAAGYPQSPPFMQIGQCEVWSGVPTGGAGAQSVTALSGALQQALASLGVQPAAPEKFGAQCGVATTPAEAHLLVWVFSDAPPTLPRRNLPTFLASSVLGPSDSPGAAQGGGVKPPRPAVTGNGGLASDDAVLGGLALAAICASITVGGRLLTRRRLFARDDTTR